MFIPHFLDTSRGSPVTGTTGGGCRVDDRRAGGDERRTRTTWLENLDKWNFSWENHGKTMEKTWKKHGKTWDMPMINGGFYGQIIYQWWIFQHAWWHQRVRWRVDFPFEKEARNNSHTWIRSLHPISFDPWIGSSWSLTSRILFHCSNI